MDRFVLPEDLRNVLSSVEKIVFPKTKAQLVELCYDPNRAARFNVSYDISEKESYVEADVVRCKNGPSVNFTDAYMRRRDPDCMFIGDDLPTDKPKFEEKWGYPFSRLRLETMDWLSCQELVVMPFMMGSKLHSYESLVVAPVNVAFFAFALANIQKFVSIEDVEEGYAPRAIIYVAPPFRHTHFGGKQAVVHYRSEQLHEIFSYNLYPGSSAKKGVFSALIDIGEQEGWVTNHASAALLQTPYDSEVVFMHEGASDGGKSEMLEEVHRESDERVLLGEHIVTGERFEITLGETCEIFPIADDMVMAHCDMQEGSHKLAITDAENGWFLRPKLQSKLGEEGYDKGAKIITDFFKEELKQFLVPELDPLGRQIIELCMNDALLEDYLELTPIRRVRGR